MRELNLLNIDKNYLYFPNWNQLSVFKHNGYLNNITTKNRDDGLLDYFWFSNSQVINIFEKFLFNFIDDYNIISKNKGKKLSGHYFKYEFIKKYNLLKYLKYMFYDHYDFELQRYLFTPKFKKIKNNNELYTQKEINIIFKIKN